MTCTFGYVFLLSSAHKRRKFFLQTLVTLVQPEGPEFPFWKLFLFLFLIPFSYNKYYFYSIPILKIISTTHSYFSEWK